MTAKLLKAAVWNIEGLSLDKINDDYFYDMISKFHILGFVETWTNDNDQNLSIPGFKKIGMSNRKKHKKARRNSGGIIVYAKNEIAKGITKLSKSHSDILWIKLDKTFFNLSKDLFISTIYISPEKSSYNVSGIEDTYEQLLADVTKYSRIGHIMVQGDVNAYTNTKPDFISFDVSSKNNSDRYYISDQFIPRNNLDRKPVNNSGKNLLNLCKESGLKILNGRKIGDIQGNFTCITYNGCSVVDYMLASQDLLDLICTFNVHKFTALSNHRLLSCDIHTCFNTQNTNQCKLDPLPDKFLWTENTIKEYTRNMNSSESRIKLDEFLKTDFKTSDDALNVFNSILHENAKKSAKICKHFPVSKNKRKNKKPWYCESCKDLRKIVKKYEYQVDKHPQNDEFRKQFYSYRSKYRRLCNYKEKQHRKNLLKQLNDSNDNNPKMFWEIINKLNIAAGGKNPSEEKLPQSEFVKFYQNLNKVDTKSNNFHESIYRNYKIMSENLEMDQQELKNEITNDEILEAINTLKNGKSASADMISNEMIKHAAVILLNPLNKLFNLILSRGIFPGIWNESFLVLLHKKGDKFDPGNYRAISISSNLGKLFNKIILKRLGNFFYTNNLIRTNQIGFKENTRTSDHLFTLQSIIQNYKQKHKKVFAAFIDLKKAFDTVWRVGLFYKLLKQNVPKKIFNIIHSMYDNTNCKIKFFNGLSKPFKSERGVKQGDVLSPILFNFYINDIVNTFESKPNTKPVIIENVSINILLYADDIVILSEDEQGLQNCLNELFQYFSNWKLELNVNKSKVIVFNSNGKTFLNKFTYNNSIIETVQQYCYLGIILRYNGNYNLATSSLMEKARKAYFKLKKTITINNSCKLLEKLFDCLICPILLYCSEIWGAVCAFKDSDPYEHLHIKFIKEILGVHSKTTNDACRAELARTPLRSKIQYSIVNFLNHIHSDKNSLLYQIFTATKATNPWTQKAKDLLDSLGYSYIFDNNINFNNELDSIKQRIIDQNLQIQNSNIQQSTKLSFYSNVRDVGLRPSYVDNLNNITERSAISRIRTSSHFLMIEKGRHDNIPKSERICPTCNSNQIENEEHFLLHCPTYKIERQMLSNKIDKVIHGFNNLSSKLKLKVLLNNRSPKVLKFSSIFILAAFKRRNNIIGNVHI